MPRAPGSSINRYYNTTTATFLSVDPDVATTMQAYAYADGNPVASTDPDGLCSGSSEPLCYATMQAWQEAVETAGGSLPIDYSQAYGLLTEINQVTKVNATDALQSFWNFKGYGEPAIGGGNVCQSDTEPYINLKEVKPSETFYRFTTSSESWGSGSYITPTRYLSGTLAVNRLALNTEWNNAFYRWTATPVRDTLVLDGKVAPNWRQDGGGWQDYVPTTSDFQYDPDSWTDR